MDRLAEAVEALKGSPAALEQARALTDLGAALRRANRRSEARGRPRKDSISPSAAAHARRRSRPHRAERGWSERPLRLGQEAPTASERRVAELAADGLSNPEIAQSLFVTRKTVETHLGRVYRKLDISGRGELDRVLAHEA